MMDSFNKDLKCLCLITIREIYAECLQYGN